jgi:hypothetical protein
VPIWLAGNVQKIVGALLKLTKASALDEANTAVRANVVLLVRVINATSHSAPLTPHTQVVSPSVVNRLAKVSNPDTAPVVVYAPVPVVLVVSLTRSATLCAIA